MVLSVYIEPRNLSILPKYSLAWTHPVSASRSCLDHHQIHERRRTGPAFSFFCTFPSPPYRALLSVPFRVPLNMRSNTFSSPAVTCRQASLLRTTTTGSPQVQNSNTMRGTSSKGCSLEMRRNRGRNGCGIWDIGAYALFHFEHFPNCYIGVYTGLLLCNQASG